MPITGLCFVMTEKHWAELLSQQYNLNSASCAVKNLPLMESQNIAFRFSHMLI